MQGLSKTILVGIINKSPFPNPEYSTSGASGMDIRAWLSNPEQDTRFAGVNSETGKIVCTLWPNDRLLIRTGILVSIPDGYELQIRPRSGLALKHGITIVNAPGTIDSDYRGEIGIILLNTSRDTFDIVDGDRIAQAVLCPIVKAQWENRNFLDEQDRGKAGFGTTGLT